MAVEPHTIGSRPIHYLVLSIDLSVARTNVKFDMFGDVIAVLSLDGSVTVRVNDVRADAIDLTLVKRIDSPFMRFYITNTAQAGKTLDIAIGGEASFTIEPLRAMTLADSATRILGVIVDSSEVTIDNINRATTPVIYNVTMTTANYEYVQALPANTKKFLIHTRDGTLFRLAFVTGKVATPTVPYFTIPANMSYNEDLIQVAIGSLYFACADAGKIVEIIVWS